MKDHFDSANEFWQTAPSFMRLLLSLSLCLTVTAYTQDYIFLIIHHQLLQYMSCGYDSDEGDEDDQPPASAHYGRSVFLAHYPSSSNHGFMRKEQQMPRRITRLAHYVTLAKFMTVCCKYYLSPYHPCSDKLHQLCLLLVMCNIDMFLTIMQLN